MSIAMNVQSPNKKEMAEILRTIATFIEKASNQTVAVTLNVTFNACKEAEGHG